MPRHLEPYGQRDGSGPGDRCKAVQAEMTALSVRFRHVQFDALSTILISCGTDTGAWPAEPVMPLMDSVAQFMDEQRAYRLTLGHA